MRRAVVAHTYISSTLEGRGRRISEFEASLVYRVSSRTHRTIQRNPVSKTKENKQTNKNQIKEGRLAGWLLTVSGILRGLRFPKTWE